MSHANRILVVDDDRSVTAFVTAILRRAGFETSQAGGYDEGLRALDADPCDAVISDIFLGEGKTGLDLMRARRCREPVILMTGMADLETSIAAVKEGAVDYLLKPLHIDELLSTVRKAVSTGADVRAREDGSTRGRFIGGSRVPVSDAEAPRFPNNRYLLYKRLAKTGFSDVWLGWQPSLWRKVVVKFATGTERDGIERFHRESRIHASLKHAGIPAVHEIGFEPVTRRNFQVIEYVDGIPIGDYSPRLGSRATEPERIAALVRLAASVAGVLSYLHGVGIVHRDVKPQNILVTPAEQVFLIDYGMACSLDGSEGLTEQNVVQGTVPFMSPEHTWGRAATVQADVWCLAASLYRLLTREYPFGSGDIARVAERIRAVEPAAPRLVNPAIPPAVERVLLLALQKDPAKRYASMAEMSRDLRAALGTRILGATLVLTGDNSVVSAAIAAPHAIGAGIALQEG